MSWIGHGTHALGLLIKIATCAEIYILEWKVDILSVSFGIHEYNEPMEKAISNALHIQTSLFTAASNDGANRGRAFPAEDPGVFCINSTDGYGNAFAFNPTAEDNDVNFSILGENIKDIRSYMYNSNLRLFTRNLVVSEDVD